MSRWVDDESTLEELPSEGSQPSGHHDLHVVLECDRPLAGSSRHCLDDIDEVVIARGRERTSTREISAGVRRLVVTVPDSRMSSSHAKLQRLEGGFLFEDTASRNGSYLMGRRVDRAPLLDGSIFELGHTHFLMRSHRLHKALTDGPPDIALPVARHPVMGTFSHEHESLFARLVSAAKVGVPVMLVGEAGSGKDTLARAIHEEVGHGGEFVVIDCARLGRGPRSGRDGDELLGEVGKALDRATGGTLFLNEIEELSPVAQLALLPMLGHRSAIGVPTLIASMRSRRDMRSDVPRVHSDLLTILAGFTMPIPPLRDRREDMGMLVARILRRWGGTEPERIAMDPAMGQSLLLHDWAYNIGELETCVRTAVALSTNACIQWSPATLPPPRLRAAPPNAPALHAVAPAARPPHPSHASEPDAEFVQNVRRALKCNLSVAGLQKNALLRSQMVLKATNGSRVNTAAVPALKDIFLSAIETMRNASPRGEKQSSVLMLTFVKPTSTQQEAADRLAMAFGTYRRYVTSALAELTSMLWFTELSARAIGDLQFESPLAVNNTAPIRQV